MRTFLLFFTLLFFAASCNEKQNMDNESNEQNQLVFGGDFSIMKKLEDLGGEYKLDGEVKEGFQIFKENGNARWDELTTLLKAGIRGVKEVDEDAEIPIMIHAATGGNLVESDNFYNNILQRGVEFDVIGLSYYPWWHGTFEDLEKNLEFLSNKYTQEISVVETAYYANGWYPEPAEWVLDVQPFPPTEQGQHDFLVDLATRLKKYPKVTSVYYWKPDGLDMPGSEIPFLGRSLFDRDGNAFKGISAWDTQN